MMGAITQAQQDNEQRLAKRQRESSFKALMSALTPQFQAVMPKGFDATRLVQLAISARKTTKHLDECSNESVLSCCLRCATLGMEPSAVDGLGRAYILPYWDGKMKCYNAQFILGKNGMIELVQRSGKVSNLRTQCVYEGDEFSYSEDENGIHFSYSPNLDAPHSPETLKLVYLSARLKDGGFVFLPMGKAEIDRMRDRSSAKTKDGRVVGPWATDYEAMAEKTVLRRAFNRGMLPRAVETEEQRSAATAITQDETTPVVLDEDGYEVFGGMPDAAPAEQVDTETGEVK